MPASRNRDKARPRPVVLELHNHEAMEEALSSLREATRANKKIAVPETIEFCLRHNSEPTTALFQDYLNELCKYQGGCDQINLNLRLSSPTFEEQREPILGSPFVPRKQALETTVVAAFLKSFPQKNISLTALTLSITNFRGEFKPVLEKLSAQTDLTEITIVMKDFRDVTLGARAASPNDYEQLPSVLAMLPNLRKITFKESPNFGATHGIEFDLALMFCDPEYSFHLKHLALRGVPEDHLDQLAQVIRNNRAEEFTARIVSDDFFEALEGTGLKRLNLDSAVSESQLPYLGELLAHNDSTLEQLHILVNSSITILPIIEALRGNTTLTTLALNGDHLREGRFSSWPRRASYWSRTLDSNVDAFHNMLQEDNCTLVDLCLQSNVLRPTNSRRKRKVSATSTDRLRQLRNLDLLLRLNKHGRIHWSTWSNAGWAKAIIGSKDDVDVVYSFLQQNPSILPA
ncbi:expressed unknown protein [Seminavis robusta]|uniref:Uncharacterized protein n=1 Tax=Seminavis robusta TaxID=568900 RepID=A0A9N8HBA3_9STRA|nr:expressed unknown protein [Seminavis robusta]|eukprot:Sro176_g077280.1 n/a (460) ;mRNA; f:21246-22722